MNRFVWNLRSADALALPGDATTEKLLKGPLVPPAEYQVQLRLGEQVQTVLFTVLKDPRVTASDQDLRVQYDLHQRIQAQLSAVHRIILQLRDVRVQVQDWQWRTKNHAIAPQLQQAGDALIERLTAIEQELVEPKADSALGFLNRLNARLAILASMLDSADAAPPRQYEAVFDHLAQLSNAQIERYQALLRDDLPAFNARLSGAGLGGVVAPEE